ncbi:EVE domain-containing protein [Flexithrix dorotheae]|uniref:EVE domain-containing protein n=1 Tax=Flexithrix dorotheae TaxID=70993 RepID=UPI00047583CC|nr:EVE domain-containing protein [Flexithrix dorotheae]
MNYWLVKSEPEAYSWDNFIDLGRDHWDGVRNYQARNFMKDMKVDDLVLFYHSGKEKQVVGIAKVVKEFYQDPTTTDERWVVVDLVPEKKLNQPVTLQQIKADERLQNVYLIRQSRLSVMPLKPEEFDIIIGMGEEG